MCILGILRCFNLKSHFQNLLIFIILTLWVPVPLNHTYLHCSFCGINIAKYYLVYLYYCWDLRILNNIIAGLMFMRCLTFSTFRLNICSFIKLYVSQNVLCNVLKKLCILHNCSPCCLLICYITSYPWSNNLQWFSWTFRSSLCGLLFAIF